MGEDWESQPPYPNWASYGNSLREYAMDRLADVQTHESPGEFKAWLESNLDEMTSNGTNRELNQVVAVQLYPIFQSEPNLWQSIEQLNLNPDLEGDLKSYLQRWHDTVASENRDSVLKISSRLGYKLEQWT